MKISWLILTYYFIQIHVQVDQIWVRNESSDSHQSEGFVLQCGWESLFGWWICLRLCGWRTLAQDVSIHNVKKSRMVRKSDANCQSFSIYHRVFCQNSVFFCATYKASRSPIIHILR